MAAQERLPRDFGFGSDEEMVRDMARKFLDENLPVEKLRALVADDHEAVYTRGERPRWDEGLWKQIVELGWPGLAVPEDAGGVGFKTVGIAALVEEVGRHGFPSPLIPTLCAAFVLREARGEVADAWLARIADGTPASLAITDARGTWEPDACGCEARDEGEDLVLSGAAHFVQDALKARVLVTTARRGDAIVLCAVPTESAGLTLQQDHIHDLTRDQATAHFDRVRVSRENLVSVNGADEAI